MNPQIYLLDGAQGLILIPIFFFLHMGSTMLIEGAFLYYFRYKTFGRCLLDAFIANLCSLGIGLLLTPSFTGSIENIFLLLLAFYIVTIIVEGLVLWARNRFYPFGKLVLVTVLMNLVTYCTLYLILQLMERIDV